MKEYWQNLSSAQKFKYIVSGIIGIFVLIFDILNWETTEVHFIIAKIRISKTLLILLSLAGGFGLATLFDYRKFRKKDKIIKDLKAKFDELAQGKE